MYRFLLGLILVILLSSCATIKMSYNRDRILNKYSEGFQIYLDSSLIDLENYYLDSDNIKSIVRDKKKDAIYIDRDSMIEFLDFKEFFNESEKERLVIINGVPLDPEIGKNMKVSPKALIEVTVLKNDTINSVFTCRTNKDILLFRIKQ